MKCPYCGGHGWSWVGVASNAERQPCEPCGGQGRDRVDRGRLMGLLLVLGSALFSIWVILHMANAAFGAEAGKVALSEFRAYHSALQVGAVNGAFAVTDTMGIRCPTPNKTVGEYIAALQYRSYDVTKPWVTYLIQLMHEAGCRPEPQEKPNA